MAKKLDDVPVRPGRMVRVENLDRPSLPNIGEVGADFYCSVWIENAASGLKEPLLLTANEYERARLRAIRNAEDVPRIDQSVARVSMSWRELDVYLEDPRTFPDLQRLHMKIWRMRLQIAHRSPSDGQVVWTLYERDTGSFLLRCIRVAPEHLAASVETVQVGGRDDSPKASTMKELLAQVAELDVPGIAENHGSPSDQITHRFRYASESASSEFIWSGHHPENWLHLAILVDRIEEIFESDEAV